MSAIVEWYKDLMYNRNDPRTNDWFLISGPGPVLTIIVTYIYFSISAGPRYMRDRKPYNLKNTLIVYNFVQVLLSIYLVYEGLMAGWLYDYSFSCQPVDYSNDPKSLRMARAVYGYFLCKLIELLDTVFFIFRKKQRQVTFLHVYHHALMPWCAWIGVRFVAGGHSTLLGLINSFIHIIMYTYYMLAALGPQMQPYLWWKKYLTLMQIVQFMIILVHHAQVMFNGCNFPKPLSMLLIINSVIFLYLFGSFYVTSYMRRRKLEKTNEVTESKRIQNNSAKDEKFD